MAGMSRNIFEDQEEIIEVVTERMKLGLAWWLSNHKEIKELLCKFASDVYIFRSCIFG